MRSSDQERIMVIAFDKGSNSPAAMVLVKKRGYEEAPLKRFLLETYVTFSFIIFVFVFFPFYDVNAIKFPICKLVINDNLMSFLTL